MAEKTKPDGWFSRRHETNEAHNLANEHYRNRHVGRPKQTWDSDKKEWVR